MLRLTGINYYNRIIYVIFMIIIANQFNVSKELCFIQEDLLLQLFYLSIIIAFFLKFQNAVSYLSNDFSELLMLFSCYILH